MSSWINLRAVGEIVVVSLLAGAGPPALFALGLRALGMPGKGHVTVSDDELGGGNPAGIVIATV